MANNNPSIILVRPQLPENIGLTVRAMHNCGLEKLIIVSPREEWPNQKAFEAAANAKVILEKVKVFDSIIKAVSNYNFVIATSARKQQVKNNCFFRKGNTFKVQGTKDQSWRLRSGYRFKVQNTCRAR